MRILMLTIFFAISFCTMTCKQTTEPTPIETPPVTDTTSHNFVVTRVDTIGDWFSTVFCADIVDENNIWIGGEFTTKDSASNYRPFTHNLAQWNGEKWTKSKIEFIGYNNTGPSIQEIGAIKVFPDSSVFLLTRANSYALYNKGKWSTQYIYPFGATYMWARNSKSIFFAGKGYGYAGYWDGETFTKMNTGVTNPPFFDIWGDEEQAYIIGKPDDINRDGTKYVMLYTNNTVNWEVFNTFPIFDSIPQPPNINLGGLISIFRANSKSKLWVLGGGALNEITAIKPVAVKKFFTIPNVFYSKYVRGNADNDLFLFGEIGDKIWHFNGNIWKIIDTPKDFLLLSAVVKNDIIVLVGATPGGIATQGIVVTLKRY